MNKQILSLTEGQAKTLREWAVRQSAITRDPKVVSLTDTIIRQIRIEGSRAAMDKLHRALKGS